MQYKKIYSAVSSCYNNDSMSKSEYFSLVSSDCKELPRFDWYD